MCRALGKAGSNHRTDAGGLQPGHEQTLYLAMPGLHSNPRKWRRLSAKESDIMTAAVWGIL
jgi:hypothetical protein